MITRLKTVVENYLEKNLTYELSLTNCEVGFVSVIYQLMPDYQDSILEEVLKKMVEKTNNAAQPCCTAMFFRLSKIQLKAIDRLLMEYCISLPKKWLMLMFFKNIAFKKPTKKQQVFI